MVVAIQSGSLAQSKKYKIFIKHVTVGRIVPNHGLGVGRKFQVLSSKSQVPSLKSQVLSLKSQVSSLKSQYDSQGKSGPN